jgi:hypothetical protein
MPAAFIYLLLSHNTQQVSAGYHGKKIKIAMSLYAQQSPWPWALPYTKQHI